MLTQTLEPPCTTRKIFHRFEYFNINWRDKFEINLIVLDFPAKMQVHEKTKSSLTALHTLAHLLIKAYSFLPDWRTCDSKCQNYETSTNRSLCNTSLNIVIVKTLCSSWCKNFVDISNETLQRWLTIIWDVVLLYSLLKLLILKICL